MLKGALAKVASGLLIGVGFGIAMTAIAYAFSNWQMSEIAEDLFREYTPDAGLVIQDHRPQKTEANSAFIGTIANNGKDTWDSVSIIVELFATDGEFVDKCSSYLDGSITPGQTRNFKVSCSGCRDTSLPHYDRYKIEVADASYVSPKE